MYLSHKAKLVTGLAFNKLADLLISAKTTLPAVMLILGVPAWMVGWLVPIRESGALLPQAAIGFFLRRHSARHPVWRIGMAVQLGSVAVMVCAALLLSGSLAGYVILAALVVLSIGRSACSLSVKDIEADIAKKGERGRLIGIASTVSGIVTLLVAVPLVYYQERLGTNVVTGLMVLAGFAFLMTLLFIFPIKSYVDVSQQHDKRSNARFWQLDSVVYRFILVRGLFVHSALVAPFFMLQSEYGAQKLLPLYLGAQAGATMLSSFVWGKLSDSSARLTLQLAGTLAIAACVGLLVIDQPSLWLSTLLFFVLSVAHSGVRTGRKTYSLDVKEGQGRTELVGVSNTAIGIILLAFGALYAALEPVLDFSLVYIMAGVLVVAILLTFTLPAEKQ
ncbi:MFS transporter [Alteromonas halophila]|uniref:MFS transporter n=1 Tax=Alteromonas halophila TaxID=516698 RepID=A0A918JEE2_9ALTE|nr:MFS transporter [Alteromonas halophila]GGW76579.1 MFS transporter [Alteromonas halophila]